MLPGTDGNSHSLFGAAGRNGLVIAFICNHCPYVRAVIGRIVRDARDLLAEGIGFVAVSSNDAVAYPQDFFANMKRFAAEQGLGFPYLDDEDQRIAAAYGAACTPDFFGLNRESRCSIAAGSTPPGARRKCPACAATFTRR